jgi:hypothetical protein
VFSFCENITFIIRGDCKLYFNLMRFLTYILCRRDYWIIQFSLLPNAIFIEFDKKISKITLWKICLHFAFHGHSKLNVVRNKNRVFNLKVYRQLSREYFTSDAIYNGSVGMTLYYYMCRSWQDCCRGEENRTWPSVSVESVDSECWCWNNTIFYVFIMRFTVE